ncbi:MAG: hypothetical protein QOF03_513 [Alphaproteobacteria bacterium]|nr:hypothetical protein [Alphaproteobacteria bacterium]
MKIRILLMAICGVLAGCRSFQAEGRNQAEYVGDGIRVDPQIAWTNVADPADTLSVWTIDSLGLDELLLFTGVAPGAPLLRNPGVARKDMVLYNTTMLPDDVMDMIAGTLGKAGDQQLRTSALRPVPFGTVTGFRFDLAFTTEDGLLMKGMALFAQRRKKLDVILFLAPSEYYYDQYAPTVEKIFSSVQVPDMPAAKPAS